MTVPGPGCSWSTRLVSWTWKMDGSGKLAESITWQIQSLPYVLTLYVQVT